MKHGTTLRTCRSPILGALCETKPAVGLVINDGRGLLVLEEWQIGQQIGQQIAFWRRRCSCPRRSPVTVCDRAFSVSQKLDKQVGNASHVKTICPVTWKGHNKKCFNTVEFLLFVATYFLTIFQISPDIVIPITMIGSVNYLGILGFASGNGRMLQKPLEVTSDHRKVRKKWLGDTVLEPGRTTCKVVPPSYKLFYTPH